VIGIPIPIGIFQGSYFHADAHEHYEQAQETDEYQHNVVGAEFVSLLHMVCSPLYFVDIRKFQMIRRGI